MTIRRLRFAVLALVCAALMTGCSSSTLHSDLHVQLSYGALAADRTPLSELKPMTVAIRVEDQRESTERDRVGDRINAYGTILAKIVAQPDAPAAMQKALQIQFENNGHRVAASDETNGPTADVLVVVLLKKCWSEAKMHFLDVEILGTVNAEVSISSVKNPSVTFTKSLSGTHRHGEQVVDDLDYQEALNGALKEFVHDLSFDPAVARALHEARGE